MGLRVLPLSAWAVGTACVLRCLLSTSSSCKVPDYGLTTLLRWVNAEWEEGNPSGIQPRGRIEHPLQCRITATSRYLNDIIIGYQIIRMIANREWAQTWVHNAGTLANKTQGRNPSMRYCTWNSAHVSTWYLNTQLYHNICRLAQLLRPSSWNGDTPASDTVPRQAGAENQ